MAKIVNRVLVTVAVAVAVAVAYGLRGAREQELFRFRIVLPDRKNSAKDMAFCPTESFHTAAQGREHAALLALLKLQEDQPLERKLPEPYK